MHQGLGPKMGDGATADVHAWASGQIVKLYKPGVPRAVSMHEARMTRAVHAAGVQAPDVIDDVTIDGRIALVMTRFDGPTLMQLTKDKSVSYAEAGDVLAACLRAVHAAAPPPDVPRLRDYLAHTLRHARAPLPPRIVGGLLALIDDLPPDAGLCHGDPNPGNVIMTPDGPRLIDWVAAVRAAPAYDLASAHVLLTELAPLVADDPERPRAVNAALQSAYARRSGMTPEALAAAMKPFLPIVRALALLGGAVPALAATLTARLERDFPE